MTPTQYERFLKWFILGIAMGTFSFVMGIICQITLTVGLLPLWLSFTIGAIYCLVKSYAMAIPQKHAEATV